MDPVRWKRPFLEAEQDNDNDGVVATGGVGGGADDGVAKDAAAAAARRAAAWAMDVYENQLNQVLKEDGLTFANKTAQWVAYERSLESERPLGERLFHDPLASYMAGKYGKLTSDVFAALASAVTFDPNGDMGDELKYDGFAYYHAARTKLISYYLATEWTSQHGLDGQVINLGAGGDTRSYWDTDGLGQHGDQMLYVEVDTKEMNEWKSQTLQKLEEEGKLPDIVCSRKIVTMDFSKESVKDLPSHDIQFGETKRTCWILEGLIMYLDQDAVVSLLTEISNLSLPSSSGSSIVLNFSNTQNSKEHHSDEFCRNLLVDKLGWRLDRTTFFGEEDFSFRRYPPGKPANKNLGFAFYSRP